MKITIDDLDRGTANGDRPWTAQVEYGDETLRVFGDTPREALDNLLTEYSLGDDPTDPAEVDIWEVDTDNAYDKHFFLRRGARKRRSAGNIVIRYSSRESAQQVADRLNAKQTP
ncbi:hypothetical protein ACFVU2_19605 [Leifsonia sp. NPDC058194]|uniref:hypothetical protein n=1 Tax=Leifsonia sp. NPDC058194 TaxID=3346374 RepID=UPI0036DAE9F2